MSYFEIVLCIIAACLLIMILSAEHQRARYLRKFHEEIEKKIDEIISKIDQGELAYYCCAQVPNMLLDQNGLPVEVFKDIIETEFAYLPTAPGSHVPSKGYRVTIDSYEMIEADHAHLKKMKVFLAPASEVEEEWHVELVGELQAMLAHPVMGSLIVPTNYYTFLKTGNQVKLRQTARPTAVEMYDLRYEVF